VNKPWPDLADAPRPADDFVGPFPEEAFLSSWWDIFGSGDPITAGDATSLLPLVVESGLVRCAGSAHLTDYHSPRGTDLGLIAESLLDIRRANNSVVLDSLPEASAHELFDQMRMRGAEVTVAEDPIGTAVIEVEGEYLSGLSKKQRHEVRRKLRRYDEVVEGSFLSIATGSDALKRFASLHRMADGDKGEFFQGNVEQFFTRLAGTDGWEFAELEGDGQVVASLFGYRTSDTYYLYNSGYNSNFREASPGIVVLYLLIEQLVESGCTRIDLLKGDEAYKFRMGAKKRPLFTVRVD
jgi:CelD/BcsL family acetyltransferase involved in cellulose biosynthesis